MAAGKFGVPTLRRGPTFAGRRLSPAATHAVAGTALFVVAVAVIGWGCWRPAWSADETASVMVVGRSFGGVLRTARFDAGLEPYYLFLKLWSLASQSHLWLRLPSVLAMAGAVTGVWSLAPRLVGRGAALPAAALMLCFPATTRFGQYARPYAFAILFVVLAVRCWVDLERGDRARQARLALLLVLAGAAHAYALAIVPVLLLASWLTSRTERSRLMVATAEPASVALLILAPYLAFVATHASGEPNPPGIGASTLAAATARVVTGLLSPALAVVCAALALGLAAAGLVAGWRRGGTSRRGTIVAALWLVLPPALLCLLQAATGAPGVVDRYWLISLPALALAAGTAVAALSARRVLEAAPVVLLAVLAVPSQAFARATNGQLGQGWLDFPRILALPALRTAPLLTQSWNYHGLVVNDPAIAARMPLVENPDPAGRIVPQVVGPGTAQFRNLIAGSPVVVVLPTPRSSATALPARAAFAGFDRELRYFPQLAVACRYFGQSVGIFTRSPSTLSRETARRTADGIEHIDPAMVRCAVANLP